MNFDFAKYGRFFALVSAAVFLAGLITVLAVGMNLGIDFTGGTVITMVLEETADSSDVEALVRSVTPNDVRVTVSTKQVEIRIQDADLTEAEMTTLLGEVTGVMEKQYTITETPVSDRVGAVAGAELIKNAVTAVLIACALMLVYIAIRFEFLTGLSALTALIHDVTVMLAIVAILQVQINSSFIAAVLTILGYSINNTIVIFDRIRENRKRFGATITAQQQVNKSVAETMNRTINTTLTTLITLLAVYILGVPSIREFTLPLLVGLLAGTYSSVFLAGPIWLAMLWLQGRWRQRMNLKAKGKGKGPRKAARKNPGKAKV